MRFGIRRGCAVVLWKRGGKASGGASPEERCSAEAQAAVLPVFLAADDAREEMEHMGH